jgi:RNA polymerase sigma factor (sigma-70 family)
MVSLALQNALRKEYGTSLREQPVPEEILAFYAGAETREDEALDILREREALKLLPAAYHRLLAYYYWGGCSEAEIAEIFGVSHQAVSKMKQSALKQLRLLMENI